MSFANFESDAEPHVEVFTEEVEDATAAVAALVRKFGQLVTAFDSQRQLIGSRRDSRLLRSSIDEKVSALYSASLAINGSISRLGRVSRTGGSQVTNRQSMLNTRLSQNFKELEGRFQKLIKLYNDKKKAFPVPAPTESSVLVGQEPVPQYTNFAEPQIDTQPQMQQQEQLQREQDLINASELEYHNIITQERDREISRVAEGVQQVNAIFKDLGALVNQQGEQLDTVENSISTYLENTRLANRELVAANEYQRKKGKWSCIILVALCVMTLVIVLVVIS